MIYLVHHADAVDASVDSQRPLSASGRVHAERLAAQAASRGVRPAVVWHSGKLRARQTAEAFWRACNPLAELVAIRGLQPGDPPDWIADRLAGETRDVMCVGHMPQISHLAARLAGAACAVPAHGLLAIAWDGERGGEAWRLGGES